MLRSDTYKITLKQTGSLLMVLSIVAAFPAVVAAIYSEWYSLAGFLISGFIIFIIGSELFDRFRKAEDPQYKDVLVIVASGWLAITLFGGLPFFIIAYLTPVDVMNKFIPQGAGYTFSSLLYFKNPLHCFFESMSAYTTTGLSMAVHEPSIGKGLLFYRCFAQWVGGAGFVITALAIFKNTSGRGAVLLYGSESTGIKLLPQVKNTTKAIWKAYLLVTLFSAIYLVLGTKLILPDYPISENIFDSINHAMAGQSTGGFSTLDDSIATYRSARMDILYLLPMILGSFSLPFFYKIIFERKFSEIWKDIQTRSLIIAFIAGSAIQALLLFNDKLLPNPVREGIFQFVSAMSTTGWQTSNINNWNWYSIVFIVFAAMFIGGASGATVGGIKMIRFLLIKKGLRWQINKAFLSENTIKVVRFNGKTLLPGEMYEEFTKAASMAIIFFLLLIGSSFITFLFTHDQFSFSAALFESGSAQGTVGLSAGITDPSMSPVLESVYIFQMWTGRLEIIPVFALVRAIFWGTRPKII
ncbi:MAG: TrkH family potassium uptake protein [Bacteroidales bacterium]|jgi:trk system potassium uptake protein TrkH|nr:TrkH family potassium uptake protein [Bacteroidales bacterium]